nr:hypothetical protein [Ectobacillus funiculus]
MDSGCLIFSGIVGGYKSEYIVERQFSPHQLYERSEDESTPI